MVKDILERHPVGVYFCSTFAISWIGCMWAAGPNFMRGESLELEDLLFVGLFVVAGPFVSGLAMTVFVSGARGLRELFSRMARWQTGGSWYSALLIFPLLLLAVSVALGAWVAPELSPIFFTPGIMMGLIAGAVEEVGWMGFAYPMMRSGRSVLRTSIYLGFLHALWHAVPDFLGNYHSLGGYWLPYFAGFFVFVIALRILIVWVYENTRSLLLAQLMHASSTGFFAVLIPTEIAPANWALFNWVYALAISAVALLVVARYGRNLKREPTGAES